MKTRAFLSALALSALLAAGCADNSPPPATGDDAPAAGSFIGRQVAKGISEAQRALETENISVGSTTSVTVNGRRYGNSDASRDLPRAEISPEGDLLIAGEPVPATGEQRELLLHHRAQIIGIAHAGMEIGARSVDVAGTALTGIGGLVFGGRKGRAAYEERVKAEAEKIGREAARLCTLLPGLYDSQQALAASMPEFVPYATLTPEDIDDCGREIEREFGPDADSDLTA